MPVHGTARPRGTRGATRSEPCRRRAVLVSSPAMSFQSFESPLRQVRHCRAAQRRQHRQRDNRAQAPENAPNGGDSVPKVDVRDIDALYLMCDSPAQSIGRSPRCTSRATQSSSTDGGDSDGTMDRLADARRQPGHITPDEMDTSVNSQGQRSRIGARATTAHSSARAGSTLAKSHSCLPAGDDQRDG